MNEESALVPMPIENQIFLVRGQRILLDVDLAALYGVEVRTLNQAVKRNKQRFPSDFVFQLTAEENEILKSQDVTSKSRHGGRRYLPYAFTEHGAIMAASVLNSPRAVEMSIFVVRAFLRLQKALATNKALANKLAELEQRLATHDEKINEIIQAIRMLTAPPEKSGRQIGFRPVTVSKPKMLGAGRSMNELHKTAK
jgi:phage regulator Rha-like protein